MRFNSPSADGNSNLNADVSANHSACATLPSADPYHDPTDCASDRDSTGFFDDTPRKTQRPSRAWLNVPNLLRWVGTLVIVFAFYSYLVQGWHETTTFVRHMILLAHTVGLTVLGLGVGQWFGEPKGARLLVMLALAAVSVNFTAFGGVIVSNWGAPAVADIDNTETATVVTSPEVSAEAFWQSGAKRPTDQPRLSVSSTTLETSTQPEPALAASSIVPFIWLPLAIVLLLPVTVIGFRVLARPYMGSLSAIFLFNNGLLLLPSRAASDMAGLLCVGALAIALLYRRDSAGQAFSGFLAMGIIERIVAFALLLLPLTILGGRSLMFYADQETVHAALAVIMYGAFLVGILLAAPNGIVRVVLSVCAFLSALALLGLTEGVLSVLPWVTPDLAVLVAAIVCLVQCEMLSQVMGAGYQGYRWCAEGLLGLAALVVALPFGSGIEWMIVVLGSILWCLGCVRKQRALALLGSFLIGLALIAIVWDLVSRFALSSWMAFVMLGIAAIVVGSCVERFGGLLKQRFALMRAALGGWTW